MLIEITGFKNSISCTPPNILFAELITAPGDRELIKSPKYLGTIAKKVYTPIAETATANCFFKKLEKNITIETKSNKLGKYTSAPLNRFPHTTPLYIISV